MVAVLHPPTGVPSVRGFMRANVFRGPGKVRIEQKPIPAPGHGEAVVRVRLTSVCGMDIQIREGKQPVAEGLTLGHEAVGTIHAIGDGLSGYRIGDRVLVGAVTPCGQCEFCLSGNLAQCGGPQGGWKLGHTMDGTQAEYVLVPHAQANLALIPDALSDEEVLPLADPGSLGFYAAESAGMRLGDMVAVFAQGPVGLCATLAARLLGASQIFAVDLEEPRLEMARRFGATHALRGDDDAASRILQLTGGRGVDVSIEALGKQETFDQALRVLRPGGTLSTTGYYYGHLRLPLQSFGSAIENVRIVTVMSPGGKERLRRLMRLVEARRVDLRPLLTHHFPLESIAEAYDLVATRGGHVLKVAVRVD